MEITFSQMTQFIGHMWWPFMRFTGFFMMAPIFGNNSIPTRVKVLLAFLFGIIISPLIKDVPAVNPFSFPMLMFSFYQLSFGLLLGLAAQLFMSIFTMAGQAISMQMGLGMAVMNDPSSGVNVAIIGRIFMITSTLIFLSLDAHLVLVQVVVDSFKFWPLNGPFPFDSFQYVLKMVSWMFSSALILAIPAIVITLLSNTTFGFMNRAAPSLNIFALGFPMTMILGMFALFLSIAGIGDVYFDLVSELNEHLYYMMGLR